MLLSLSLHLARTKTITQVSLLQQLEITVSRKRRLVCANLEVQAGVIARRAERNRLTQSSITIRDRIRLKSELVYNDPGVDTETVRPRHDIDQYCMDLHKALSTSPEDATESQRASQLIELSAQPTPNMRGGAHSEIRRKVKEWLARHRQKLKLNKKPEGQPPGFKSDRGLKMEVKS